MASSRSTDRKVKRTYKSSKSDSKRSSKNNAKAALPVEPSPSPKHKPAPKEKPVEHKKKSKKRKEAPTPTADMFRETKRVTRSDGPTATGAPKVGSSPDASGTGSGSSGSKKTRSKAGFHPNATKAYRAHWGTVPSKESQSTSEEERLRAKFFVTSGFMPRCHTCQALREPMPKNDNRPTGREDMQYVPCGCVYDESILEMFLVDKGIIPTPEQWRRKDSDVDKNRLSSCAGRRKPFLMGLFEELLGEYAPEKLFDPKARAKACMEMAKNGNRKGSRVPVEESTDNSDGESGSDADSEGDSQSERESDGEVQNGGDFNSDEETGNNDTGSNSSFYSASD